MWAWLGLAGPGLVAVLFALKSGELKVLFRPLLKWRISWVYYLLTTAGVFGFDLLSAFLTTRIWGGSLFVSSWRGVSSPLWSLSGVFVYIEMFYYKANQNLLICAILHGSVDTFGQYFPVISSHSGQGPNGLTVIIQIVIALCMLRFLYRCKP